MSNIEKYFVPLLLRHNIENRTLELHFLPPEADPNSVKLNRHLHVSYATEDTVRRKPLRAINSKNFEVPFSVMSTWIQSNQRRQKSNNLENEKTSKHLMKNAEII